MKDKKPIARNDKNLFVFFLIVFALSLPFSINFLRFTAFRWFGIFIVSSLIFVILFESVILIILPKYVIIQEGQNLIIYRGVFKDIFPCSDIVKVQLAPLQKGEKEKKNGGIILTVKTENGVEEGLHISVQDKEQVVERIKEIIENFSAFSKTEPVNMQNIEQSE